MTFRKNGYAILFLFKVKGSSRKIQFVTHFIIVHFIKNFQKTIQKSFSQTRHTKEVMLGEMILFTFSGIFVSVAIKLF